MDDLQTNEAVIHRELAEREIRPRDRRDPLAEVCFNGYMYSREEATELKRRHDARIDALQISMKNEWMASEGGRLCMAFFQAFRAYKDYLEKNMLADYKARDLQENYYEEHELFRAAFATLDEYQQEQEQARSKNLEKAKKAARCQHLHANGEQCGSPRMRGRKLCYMHEQMEERPQKLDLGPLEDPDSIQVAIRKLQSAIIEGTLDSKQLGQLAYTIQLAAWNVTRTTDRRERVTS